MFLGPLIGRLHATISPLMANGAGALTNSGDSCILSLVRRRGGTRGSAVPLEVNRPPNVYEQTRCPFQANGANMTTLVNK